MSRGQMGHVLTGHHGSRALAARQSRVSRRSSPGRYAAVAYGRRGRNGRRTMNNDRNAVAYRILGPLDVVGCDGSLPLGGPKQRAVLALLVLNANQVVSRERLVDSLWGDAPPEPAVATVQVYISRLGKVLPEGSLVTRGRGYVLEVDPEAVDLVGFETLIAEARTAGPGRASRLFRDALALWRGLPLAEFDEPFVQVERG